MRLPLLVVGSLALLGGCSKSVPVTERPESTKADGPVVQRPVAAPTQDLERQVALLEDPQRHGDAGATTWNLENPFPITAIPTIPPQGSLECWIHVPEPAQGRTIDAEIHQGGKSWRGRIVLTWRGWSRVVLPMQALEGGDGSTRNGLVLRTTGAAGPGCTLAIAGVRVGERTAGANLGDDDLLAQIDWSIPGLATPRARLAAGDKAGALAGLAAYFRTRARHWGASATMGDPKAADAYLAGEVGALGLKHRFPQGRIDWLANPTLGSGEASSEWVWSLNRHNDWMGVGQAFQATKQEKYAAGWARLMNSFVEQAPAPGVAYEKPGSAWRDIEAGLRTTSSWFTSFYDVVESPAVTDRDILTFVKAVWDHGRFLAGAEFNPSNHYVFAMTGLYTVGGEFPEFREAKSWRQRATRQLERSFAGFLPEGGWYELAPGYGSWVCSKLIEMWNHAEISGQTAEISPQLRAKLEKVAEWGVRLMGPDRMVPMLNDGGPLKYEAKNTAILAKRFPKSDLLRWAAADLGGQTGVAPPAWTSEALPDSGYQVMRTGWGTRDSYVLLDAGPLGGWHGHQDALNLVAYFHGRYFLFDNGGYKYDSSVWRKWGPSTAAHNTVLVDGLGQRRNWNGAEDPIGRHPPGLPASVFSTSPAVDYASAWYMSGYGPVSNRGKSSPANDPTPASHHREVLFLKPTVDRGPVVLVLDTLEPVDAKAHAYEVRWHLKTTHWQVDDARHITWTTDADQPNLAVVPVSGADTFHADSGVKTPELLGWWFEGQAGGVSPALTLRQGLKTTGKVRILTALVPFTGSADRHPVTAITSAGSQAWTVEVRDQAPFTVRLTSQPQGPGLAVDGITPGMP